MMRFYRPTVEALLIQSVYHQENIGSNLSDMAHALRNFSLPGGKGSLLSFARKSVGNNLSLNARQLTETLFDQLSEDQSPRRQSDLVDELVRILQLPYARNALSGDTLRRLRAAVLLPSEQGGLLHRLRQREIACAGCGTAFHDHESITFIEQEGSITLHCHRCSPPLSVSCAGCEANAELSSKASSTMSRMLCAPCLAKKQAGQSLTPPQAVRISNTPEPVRARTPFASTTPGRAFSSFLSDQLLNNAGQGLPAPDRAAPAVAVPSAWPTSPATLDGDDPQ